MSIRNGQRGQAFRQMREIEADDLAEMMDYFVNDLADAELALDAAKTYFRSISTRGGM
jgi:hypothetical protein